MSLRAPALVEVLRKPLPSLLIPHLPRHPPPPSSPTSQSRAHSRKRTHVRHSRRSVATVRLLSSSNPLPPAQRQEPSPSKMKPMARHTPSRSPAPALRQQSLLQRLHFLLIQPRSRVVNRPPSPGAQPMRQAARGRASQPAELRLAPLH